MIRSLLCFFGLEIVYVCAWGTYKHRYNAIDFAMTRPIHEKMSVAPYWAKMRIRRIVESAKAPDVFSAAERAAVAALRAWNNTPEDHPFEWPADFPEGSRNAWMRVVAAVAKSLRNEEKK